MLSFLVSLSYSCTNKTEKKTVMPIDGGLIIINMDDCKKEDEINASYFFDNIRTIILETNEDALIENIKNVMVHDNFILVFDISRHGDLFIFHSDGRFSHKIGNRGTGPGEYIKISDFSLDKDNNDVYILDNSSKCIIKHKLSTGEFISSTRLKTNRFPSSIQYFDENLYLDACDVIGNEKELLYKIDKNDGSEVYSWLSADIYNQGWIDACFWENGFFLSRDANNPKYTNLFMDTVMSITQDGIKPYLVVNAKKWVKKEDLQEIQYEDRPDVILQMEKKERTFGISKLVEVKDAIFFSLISDNNFYNVFRSPEEIRVCGRIIDDMAYNGEQFPLNKMVCSDENGVYAVSNPHLFAQYTGRNISDILKEDLDKRELLVQLSEDSNPVIFYYEYR